MTKTVGLGTDKRTIIEGINKVVVSYVNDDILSVLRLGTTGTTAFKISSHSKLKLPVNCPFHKLSGNLLRELQTRFSHVRLMIMDMVSMMGKMIYYIDQRLRQISGQANVPFGGDLVIFVGDFQQLPPVRDKAMYEEESGDSFTLFDSFSEVVELVDT